MRARMKVFVSSSQRMETEKHGLRSPERLRRRLKDLIDSILLGNEVILDAWLFEGDHAGPEPVTAYYRRNLADTDLVVAVIGARIPPGVLTELTDCLELNKPLLPFLKTDGHTPLAADEWSDVLKTYQGQVVAGQKPPYRWWLYGLDPDESESPRWNTWNTEKQLLEQAKARLVTTVIDLARSFGRAVEKGRLFSFPSDRAVDGQRGWLRSLRRQVDPLILSGARQEAVQVLEQALTTELSPQGRSAVSMQLGWAFVRSGRYHQAVAAFDEARYQRCLLAHEATNTEDREEALTSEARARGPVALALWYMGRAREAEEMLTTETCDAGLGYAWKPTVPPDQLRGIIGIERQPRRDAYAHLRGPLDSWFGEDLDTLLDCDVNLAGAADTALATLDTERATGQLSGMEQMRTIADMLMPAKARSSASWSAIGDGLFELAKWYLDDPAEDAWGKSYRLALASLWCYRQMDFRYPWGHALALAGLARSIYRALKGDQPDRPGLQALHSSQLGDGAPKALSATRQLLLRARDLHWASGNARGEATSLRSLNVLAFDTAVAESTWRSDSLQKLSSQISDVCRVHRIQRAEREAIVDQVLDFRTRVFDDPGKLGTLEEGIRAICERADFLGCRRLKAEIGFEFLRGTEGRRSGRAFRELGVKPRGTIIL